MAKISSTSKSYRDLGFSGFGKLAKYIFGGSSVGQGRVNDATLIVNCVRF